MRARDLSEPYPSIDLAAPAIDAVRMIGAERRPAVVVLDAGRPVMVLPASQVVRFLIPRYLQEDPGLVRVYDERAADASVQQLRGRSVRDLMPERYDELPEVDPDDTLLECAAVMASTRTPLLVVVEDSRMTGAITAARLLDTLIVGAP